MKNKKRLDVLLLEKGYFESREKARRAIMAGKVIVDDKLVDKPGKKVSSDSAIRLIGDKLKYVSRGGLKLEKALEEFDLNIKNKIVMDIGASTGGFTDCALQYGAKKVYAVDVGYGQLDWKLRQDKRVVSLERTNARYLKAEEVPDKIDVVTIDVSFISVEKIIPAVTPLLSSCGEFIVLVKPQFEAGRDKVGKGGIVKEKEVHKEVIRRIIGTTQSLGLTAVGLSYSPIKGADGNIEFLLHLRKNDSEKQISEDLIENAVEDAHKTLV